MLDQINSSKEVMIKHLDNLEQLEVVMPLLMEGYEQMRRRERFDCISREGFLKTAINVITKPWLGGIKVVFDEKKGPVGFGIAVDNTAEFDDKRTLLLWSLYVKPRVARRFTDALFRDAESWAKENGFHYVSACNSRFTGSAFKFFESRYGMRRATVTFKKEL